MGDGPASMAGLGGRDEVMFLERDSVDRRGRQADQAPSTRRLRQAFVCAVVGGPIGTGGKLGCAVVRHS